MRKVLHSANLDIRGRRTDIRLLKDKTVPTKVDYYVVYNGQRLRPESKINSDEAALYWFVSLVDLAIEASR